MTKYRIEFEPAVHGARRTLREYVFHTPDAAIAEAEHFNDVNNPAWNGMFYAIDERGRRIWNSG